MSLQSVDRSTLHVIAFHLPACARAWLKPACLAGNQLRSPAAKLLTSSTAKQLSSSTAKQLSAANDKEVMSQVDAGDWEMNDDLNIPDDTDKVGSCATLVNVQNGNECLYLVLRKAAH